MSLKDETPHNRQERHHIVGLGTATGCAHSDTELRRYINTGAIPNPNCLYIERWNTELAGRGGEREVKGGKSDEQE
jgi:hypothetical protein